MKFDRPFSPLGCYYFLMAETIAYKNLVFLFYFLYVQSTMIQCTTSNGRIDQGLDVGFIQFMFIYIIYTYVCILDKYKSLNIYICIFALFCVLLADIGMYIMFYIVNCKCYSTWTKASMPNQQVFSINCCWEICFSSMHLETCFVFIKPHLPRFYAFRVAKYSNWEPLCRCFGPKIARLPFK